MVKQKQHQLSKVDYVLFAVGFLSITFMGYYIGLLFLENIAVEIVGVILYLAIVVMYIQVLRPSSRTHSSSQFARVVSWVGIIITALNLAFLAYFIATFKW